MSSPERKVGSDRNSPFQDSEAVSDLEEEGSGRKSKLNISPALGLLNDKATRCDPMNPQAQPPPINVNSAKKG